MPSIRRPVSDHVRPFVGRRQAIGPSLFLAAGLSLAASLSIFASSAHACAVDGVAGKTDTSITISWDLSGCGDKVNSGKKFEICWKHQGHGGNACIPPKWQDDNKSGSYTITGLSPSTAYRIKTSWHKKSAWHDVTSRVVSTDPTPTSTGTLLRYEKGTPQKYCVRFYWRNPPVLSQGESLRLVLRHRAVGTLGSWDLWKDVDQTGAQNNPSTGEYEAQLCNFSNNQSYGGHLEKMTLRPLSGEKREVVSNTIQWK